LAPTGGEPIVGIVQAIVFVAFLVVGYLSVRHFRPIAVRH
jgi:hypothetical protein